MMSAGFWFRSTPVTSPPEAQVIDAEISASVPPAQLIALTGRILALGANPIADSSCDAITPAMKVPCQEERFALDQSPGSLGFESQPKEPKLASSI